MNAYLLTIAASAGPLVHGDGPSVPWARIVLSLLFCIGLAVAAIAFIRWRSGQTALGPIGALLSQVERGAPKQLELIERLPLTATSQFCLVRCGEERLLVLVSPAGAQLVERSRPDQGEMDEP